MMKLNDFPADSTSIHLRGLSRQFGSRTVLKQLDLTIPADRKSVV